MRAKGNHIELVLTIKDVRLHWLVPLGRRTLFLTESYPTSSPKSFSIGWINYRRVSFSARLHPSTASRCRLLRQDTINSLQLSYTTGASRMFPILQMCTKIKLFPSSTQCFCFIAASPAATERPADAGFYTIKLSCPI